jgi:hypothetical protein
MGEWNMQTRRTFLGAVGAAAALVTGRTAFAGELGVAEPDAKSDKDGIIPGKYRGQPIEGGQTFKVKAGDWLLIPPDTPRQPKPDTCGFSYMVMKLNVGVYPWSLVR